MFDGGRELVLGVCEEFLCVGAFWFTAGDVVASRDSILDLFAIGETGSSSESEMHITLLSCGEAGAGGANVSCPASVFISEISELRVS